VTRARRDWYQARPERRRRLDVPVISVGNLVSGGSGKTPVVAAIARLLQAHGERPAILSRGYGRKEHPTGVLVVSNGLEVAEPVWRTGDEPLMLARALPGVSVLVCPDRYTAGVVAVGALGATVCLLDDGFQHIQLERDVDLLLVSMDDLVEPLLPFGHLREPVDAGQLADAVLVPGSHENVWRVAGAIGLEVAFQTVPRFRLDGVPPGTRVVAVAGIARPQRFVEALRTFPCEIVAERLFRDHHWYTAQDLDGIRAAVEAGAASMVVTTAKDAVRLPADALGVPVKVLDLEVSIEPAPVFENWLLSHLARARQPRTGAQP
jgi:tetraacyldisaccharide 4'-kinase